MSVFVDASTRADTAVVDERDPRNRRSRNLAIAGAVVGLLLFLVPSRPVAVFLVGADSTLLERVVPGVLAFKAILLIHLVGLPLLARWLRSMSPGQSLIPRTRRREPFSPSMIGLLLLLLATGLVLRFIDLDDGLWHDEIATLVDHSRLPLREIIATYTAQNQHILYSVLTALSFSVFGESTWALRLPAAVLGVASLGATYWFGSLVVSRREALLATALLTLSYHHVWFSQNARGYTGMLLFALIATGLLVKLLNGSGRRVWPLVIGYAITMALAVWIHLTAAFIAIAHVLVWGRLAIRERRRMRGAWPWGPAIAIVLAGSFTVLLHSLILPQMPQTLFTPAVELPGGTPWKNPLWLVAETMRGASRGLPGGWFGLVGGLAVATAGTIAFMRRSVTIALVMILPCVVTAVAMIATAHNLWPRFFFFAAGFAVLIAVRGTFVLVDLLPLSKRVSRRVATAALVLVAAVSATTIPRAWAPKQDYERALDFVIGEAQAGDAIVSTGAAAYAYDRWLLRNVLTVDNGSELVQIERAHPRTWVLYSLPDYLAGSAPDLMARLESQYREVIAFPGTIAGGTVHVMLKR
jgi:mannosyltransferase